ncbi:SDR family NAD(P)-dependent oxidoreductase [Shigella flexneri]
MNLNIKSVFFMTQAAAKHFIAQGTGARLSISRQCSPSRRDSCAFYTASKSGVMGVTRLMANEWAKHNISVNAIAPGYMATNNTHNYGQMNNVAREIRPHSSWSFGTAE